MDKTQLKTLHLKKGAKEMSQWLRALAILENLGLLPSIHMGAHSRLQLDPSSKGSDTLLWSPWVPGMQVVLRHTCKQNAHTHNTKACKKKG